MSPDFLLVHAGQLLTLEGPAGPRRASESSHIGVLPDGAMACERGRIVWTGPTDAAPRTGAACRVLDVRGALVTPGFVDPHTHPVFHGTRHIEYALRASGATYEQIAASGGGIASTVRSTRAAGREALLASTVRNLSSLLHFGTTSAEAKSGYGLEPATEIDSLRIIAEAGDALGMTLRRTFLALHAVPGEFAGRAGDYVDLMTDEVLPLVASEGLADYVDVFCERGAFDAVQSGRFLRAARSLGLGIRVHADEFSACGGAELAAELGAASADHLLRASDEGIRAMAASGTVAVLLPGTAFVLGLEFPDARRFLDAGVPVALSTDFNPGSCYCPSMPFILSAASSRCGMTVEQAITASTVNAAASAGLPEKGRLCPGCDADFVVWDLDDYRGIPYHLAAPDIRSVHLRAREARTAGG